MCQVLKELYRKVYDEPFDYNKLDNRIKLQKAVYLLENIGVHVGDYSFSWNTYGPYSLELDRDAYICNANKEQEVKFSDYAEKGLKKIKSYAGQNGEYSCVYWMECIASLLYLKKVFRYKESNLILELQIRKSYLSDEMTNKRALSILKEIEVGV